MLASTFYSDLQWQDWAPGNYSGRIGRDREVLPHQQDEFEKRKSQAWAQESTSPTCAAPPEEPMNRNDIMNQKDSGEYSGTGKGIKRKSPDGNRAVSIKADDKFPDTGSDVWRAHRVSQLDA